LFVWNKYQVLGRISNISHEQARFVCEFLNAFHADSYHSIVEGVTLLM